MTQKTAKSRTWRHFYDVI